MVDAARVRGTLLRLLNMDTPSGREGIAADFLEGELRGMGFLTWRDDAGEVLGGDTGNLLARLEGTAPHAPPLLLNAHMDTVVSTAGLVIREEDGILRASAATLLGVDDKCGVTAILEGVRAALDEGFPRPTLEIAFTVCEETGLWGAKRLDPGTLAARQAYAFDTGKPVGGIVVATPSHNNLAFTVRGMAAHVGMAPERGISAIRIAADAILRMPLGRIDEETTANIGVIEGGTADNIVPDRVECRGEARSHSEEKVERQTRAMVDAFQAAAQAAGGRVEARVERLYTRFSVERGHPLVRRAVEAGRRAGIADPVIRAAGGGSDANVLNLRGLPTVVVGLGYENLFGADERVALADVTQASRIVAELLRLAGMGQ
ncbi:MAG: M20/M25/M40 family metallo-hydrolase [Armatimonadetes bacterium]|nr:M20/M25/M40 family metallo-hydrolase [Armatimonadota bacterium]